MTARDDAILREPDPALVQATADLLAARNGLYMTDPDHRLLPAIDNALAALLSPRMVVEVPHA